MVVIVAAADTAGLINDLGVNAVSRNDPQGEDIVIGGDRFPGEGLAPPVPGGTSTAEGTPNE